MKLIKTLLLISLLVPSLAFATIAVGFNATSTDPGYIIPNAVNGVVPYIKTPGLYSTASSTIFSLYGAGLVTCNAVSSALTWSGGVFGCNSISGGSSFAFPFTINTNYNSTTTVIGFLNGMFSNSTTTLVGNVFLPSLTAGQLNVGANGLLYSGATTTFSGGLTYSNGNVTCTGCGAVGNPDLTYFTQSGTRYYNASSTASDNLSWFFRNGFVSNASSTFSAGVLFPSLTSGFAGIGANGLLYTFSTSTIKTSQLTNDAGFVTSSGVTAVTGTWPIISSGGNTPNITFGGISTTTALTTGQVAGISGVNTLYSVPTTTPTISTGLSYSGTWPAGLGGVAGNLTNTGLISATCSGGTTCSGTNPILISSFSYPFPSGATSSPLSLTGLLTMTYSSTTGQSSFANASSTQWVGGGLSTCDPTTGKLTWNSTTLQFGCGTDFNTGGSSFAFPFTINTNYNSTSTSIGFTGANSLFATGSTTFSGALHIPTIVSSFLSTDALGNVYGAATSSIKTSQLTNDSGFLTTAGFSPNSVITSNSAGSLIATGTQLTVGNIIATTSASSQFWGNLLVGTTSVQTGGNIAAFYSNTAGGTRVEINNPNSVGITNLRYYRGTTITANTAYDSSLSPKEFQAVAAEPGAALRLYTTPTGVVNALSRLSILDSGFIGIATNTPLLIAQATISSSTASQLSLSDGTAGDSQWTFRNAGGNFYLSTTTVQGVSTSTNPAAVTILNNGRFGLGTSSPPVLLSVNQNSGFGTYAGTGGTTADVAAVFSSVITTKSPSLIVADVNSNLEVSLTGSPTFYAMLSINGTTQILPTDNATYAAGSFMAGGFYASTYNGTGSIASVYGVQASASRGGNGAVTNLIAIDLAVKQTATAGTVTVSKGININQPTGSASGVTTDTYGLFMASQTQTGGTQTNNPYGIYQAGTADYNYFGGKTAIGTTTPPYQLTAVSSSLPQLALGNGVSGNYLWTFRSANGSLFIATTTAQGTATSTNSALVISPLGLVGILSNGTPQSSLAINGIGENTHTLDIYTPNYPNAVQNVVSLNRTNNNQANSIQFEPSGANSATNVNWIMGMPANSDNYAFQFWNGSTVQEKISITDKGKVGIATTTPIYELTIASSTGPQIALSTGVGVSQVTLRTAGGAFYISTTTVQGLSTTTLPSLGFNPNGIIILGNYGNCTGTNALQVSANLVVCGSTVSDSRLKKDIKPITDGLDLIMKLKPVTYNWKDLTNHNTTDPREQMGFIAQDVEPLIPSAIGLSDDGFKTLDKAKIIPYLVGAIQELAKIKGVAGQAKRSAEENWQNVLIGLLILGFVYQQIQIRKLKKQ